MTANNEVIYRYEVPVDDRWHELDIPGGIVHVAARRADVVEVWGGRTLRGQDTRRRQLRVFGTGQPLPVGVLQHVGTAITPDGRLVWHLIEDVYREGRDGDSADR